MADVVHPEQMVNRRRPERGTRLRLGVVRRQEPGEDGNTDKQNDDRDANPT
jgi:hypothetical protein